MLSFDRFSVITQDDILAFPFSFNPRLVTLIQSLLAQLVRKRPKLPIPILVGLIVKQDSPVLTCRELG